MFLDNLSVSVLRICDRKNLTYDSASERCDISARYFGDIARRKSAPTIRTLEKLCAGLETTPNELLLDPPLYPRDAALRLPPTCCLNCPYGRAAVCGVTWDTDLPLWSVN